MTNLYFKLNCSLACTAVCLLCACNRIEPGKKATISLKWEPVLGRLDVWTINRKITETMPISLVTESITLRATKTLEMFGDDFVRHAVNLEKSKVENGKEVMPNRSPVLQTYRMSARGELTSSADALTIRRFRARLYIFPDKPIAVGEEWKYAYSGKMTNGISAESIFRLISCEGTGSSQTAKITMEFHENAKVPILCTATFIIRVRDGLLIESTISTQNEPNTEQTGTYSEESATRLFLENAKKFLENF